MKQYEDCEVILKTSYNLRVNTANLLPSYFDLNGISQSPKCQICKNVLKTKLKRSLFNMFVIFSNLPTHKASDQ